LKVNLH